MSEGKNIPPNMTEESILNVVREFCGDDMTDEELIKAYRSGFFQELCPDIESYARATTHDTPQSNEENESSDRDNKIKSEKSGDESRPCHVKDKEEKKTEPEINNLPPTRIKDEADSESESIASEKRSYHKKKKKKHSKDHKKRDKEKGERKEKSKIKSEHHKAADLDDLSDAEYERKKKDEKLRKEKKKRVAYITSSNSDSDQCVKKPEVSKSEGKNDKKDSAEKGRPDENEKAKVHPFYREKESNPEAQSTSKEHSEPKREKTPEKKKELKPFSKYNTSISKTTLKRWRPTFHKDHMKYQRKCRLKLLSIVCVDLLDFPMVFHHPRRHSKNPNAVPLSTSSPVNMSSTRLEMIRRLERDKTNWFKKKINRRALKFLKLSKHKRFSSDEDERKPKRARIMDRIVSSSDTNSDSSSIVVPSKKAKKDHDDHRERSGGKLSKAEKDAEVKRRKIDELKKKVDKFSRGGTRVLPWENKDNYFKNSKKKDDLMKDKEKLIAEKKKRMEQLQKERLEKQKNAPTVSFQRILKQIETANKEQAAKPKVELKIPKKNQNPDRPVPISEYKLDGKIGVGDVYKEVVKLLATNVLVECPDMPGSGDDLGEYTVKKIAWWILKNEKDPAIEGLFHPECHDDDDCNSIHDDDFDWPSDVSSINGCVSDPEGVTEIPADPKKIADPDWADDYCGEASLYAKFRKETIDTKDKSFPIDSADPFKSFLRVKPGTNYAKPNFEVKCFLCTEVLKGQRQYGAHIRSDSHKNYFRNYSLDLANYEEKLLAPEPTKVYVAHLVEYTSNTQKSNTTTEKSDILDESKHRVAKIEQVRSVSPGPIVGGDAAPNIMVHQMPIPDDISLPSIQDYDISSDESLMNVRVELVTTSKWNTELERRWRTWRDEEAKIADEYNGEREFFINEPERHPSYQEEWLKFWDQRCAELEAEGKDTENYNFHKEWMPFWLKRMQEIMQVKVEGRVADLKKSLAIDKHTLRVKFGVSAETTKRKKLKNKTKKLQGEGSSSIKSTEKVESVGHGPNQHHSASSALKSHTQNNVHSKSESLPKLSATNEDRNRERKNSNTDKEGQLPADRHHKSESRSKHDKQRDSCNYQKQDKSVNRKNHDKHSKHNQQKSQSKQIPHFPGEPLSNSNSSYLKKKPRSVSSVSSEEPPPPGEEAFSLGSSSKSERPPPPKISDPISSHAMEVNQRIENDLKNKLGRESSDLKSKSSNPYSKPNSTDLISTSNEGLKSKRVTSWSDNSSDEPQTTKKLRRDSGGSSNSSSHTLQNKLQALRDALAMDEAKTNESRERPKVIPLDKSKLDKLSDGEVASDTSDLGINKVASTFFNKEIPGLSDLTKPTSSASLLHLNKGSIGHHLLERKKSSDESHNNKHTSRSKHKQDKYNKSHDHRGERDKTSKSHSRNNDSTKHKSDHRGPKDDKRRWNTNKDGWSNDKDYHSHRDSSRGGGHDQRNTKKDFKHKNNNQTPLPGTQTQIQSAGPQHPMEESWEPEDSWEPGNSRKPQQQPIVEESWEPEDSWEPETNTCAPVPENTTQIPVLSSTSWQQPQHQVYNTNPHHQPSWNGGWGNQPPPYPPQNNFYEDYY